jgi:thiamine kinase-like enzyme
MKDTVIIAWLKAQLNTCEITLQPLLGGANNQGFKIISPKGEYFLKSFSPEHPSSNAKMKNEFFFTQHLWHRHVRSIPKPIAFSESLNISLYSFLHGKSITEVTPDFTLQAKSFVEHINTLPLNSKFLNIASESPDSLYDFLKIIYQRLNRFKDVKAHNELTTFLCDIHNRADKIKLSMPKNWRSRINKDVISPSDFGFHNALNNDQSLVFFDFEYAGQDLSWKLLADFFSQPAKPVPVDCFRSFLDSYLFTHITQRPKDFLIIFELTQLKWCLIMLNEYLSDTRKRRLFSWNKTCIDETTFEEVKIQQLYKSKAYFNAIPDKLSQLIRTF